MSAGAPRTRWWWFLAATTALSLIFVLLHAPFVRGIVLTIVESQVVGALGGSFQAESLGYRLWKGELWLDRVDWQPDAETAPLRMAADRIEASLSFRKGVSATLVAPRITFIERPGAEEREPAASPNLRLPAWVGDLRVIEGTFLLEGPRGESQLEIRELDVALIRSDAGHEGSLRASGARVDREPLHLDVDRIFTRLEIGSGDLRLAELRVDAGASWVEGSGTVESLSPFMAAFDARWELETATLHALAPAAPLVGTFGGTVRVEAEAGGLRARGEAGSRALRWGEIGPWTAQGRFELGPDGVLAVPSLELAGYDGRIAAEARLELSEDGRQLFRIEAADLSLGALIDDAWEGAPGLSSRTGVTAELRLRGFRFDRAEGSGELRFRPLAAPGRIALGGDVAFTLQEGALAFRSGRFEASPVRFSALAGELRELGRVNVDFRGVIADLTRLEELLEPLSVPPPPVALAGTAAFAGRLEGSLEEPSRMALRSRVSGEVRVEDEPFQLHAEARIDGPRLRLVEVAISGPRGSASAAGGIPLGASGGAWDLDVALDRLDVALARRAIDLPIRGEARGSVAVRGPAALPRIQAAFDLDPIALHERTGKGRIEIRKEGSLVALDAGRLELGDLSVAASGSYDLGGRAVSLHLRGRELRLSELPGWGERAAAFDGLLSSLELQVSGPIGAPAGEADAVLSEITFRGAPLPPVRVAATADGERLAIRARVEDELLLSGTALLEEPFPVDARVELSAVPFAELLAGIPELADKDPYLDAAGSIRIRFSARQPDDLRYEAAVERFLGNYAGIAGGASTPFRVTADSSSLAIQGLELIGTETAIAVDGRAPLREDEPFDLSLRGDVNLELMEALLPGIRSEGLASMALRLAGTLGEPRLAGGARIEGGAFAWGPLAVTELTAEIDGAGGRITLASLRGRALAGGFQMSGSLPLPGARLASAAELDFQLTRFDLALLIPDEDLRAEMDILVSATGRLEAPDTSLASLRGAGRILQVRIWERGAQVASEEPTSFLIENGRFRLDPLRLSGDGTRLVVEAESALLEELAWKALVRGEVGAVLLDPILPEGLGLSGALRIDLQAESAEDGPRWLGTGSLEGIELAVATPPVVLSNVRGQVALDGRTIQVSELSGAMGGGSIRGSGSLEWRPEGLALDFTAVADQVRLSYPEGFRSQLSGTVRFRGSGESYVLSGDVEMDHGIFQQNISLESQLLGALEREPAFFLEEESFQHRVQLDLRVRTEDDLRIDNNLAQMKASASLGVSGTIAAPVVSGVVIGQEGGTFHLGSNVFRIDTARITLELYPIEPPEIDLVARTRSAEAEIVLELHGSTDNLRTDLRAPDRPEWSRADVASVLLTGRPLENVPGEAGRIVGEQVASLVGGTLVQMAQYGIGQVLPFTQFTVEPRLVGGETDPGARFTIGQSLAENLFLIYSIGLNDAEKQLWILRYELPRELSLRAIRDDDNEYTASLSQELLFDLYRRPRPTRPRVEKPPRIAALRVPGDSPLPEEEIRDRLGIAEGDAYDYWEVREGAERLQKAFRRRGYLNALVEFSVHPYEEEPRQVVLTFDIRADKPIEIVWEGDTVPGAIERRVRESWDPRVPESLLVLELANRAQWRLRADRHYLAEVEAAVTDLGDRKRVVFRVSRGPRGDRVEVTFEGNAGVPRRELIGLLPAPSSPEFFRRISGGGARIKELVRLYYASRGHLETRVGDVVAEYRDQERILEVRIPLEEGPRAEIVAVEIQGAAAIPEPRLRAALSLREGELLDLARYVQGRSRLTSLYRREGYREARITSRLERTEEGVRLVYEVEEGPRATVGQIRIRGNYLTPESVIRRELTFAEGEPLRFSDLTESQSRLYDLRVFRSVDVRAQEGDPEATQVDVLVEVVERADVDFNYGARYDTRQQFEVLADVYFPSLFGTARSLGFTALVNPNDNVFRSIFTMPYFFKYRLGTDLFAAREQEDSETDFTTTWTFTFQQRRRLLETFNLQWSYSYRRIHTVGKIVSGPFPFDITIPRAILTASIIQDTRDSLTNASRGRFWNATVQLSPEQLGSEINFYKVFGQLHLYRPVGRRLVWASSYRMGIANGFGDDELIREDRFRAGGATSVRGFPTDELGPPDPDAGGVVIGGEGVQVLNQELRFPIWRWLRGAAFLDAGNVFLNFEDFDPLDLRLSAGLGVRFDLPFGLFRIDGARLLDLRPGERRFRFHFSFGQAF